MIAAIFNVFFSFWLYLHDGYAPSSAKIIITFANAFLNRNKALWCSHRAECSFGVLLLREVIIVFCSRLWHIMCERVRLQRDARSPNVLQHKYIQYTSVYLLGLLSRFSHVTRLLFSYISSLLKMTDNGANAIIFRVIQNHCASECERAESNFGK